MKFGGFDCGLVPEHKSNTTDIHVIQCLHCIECFIYVNSVYVERRFIRAHHLFKNSSCHTVLLCVFFLFSQKNLKTKKKTVSSWMDVVFEWKHVAYLVIMIYRYESVLICHWFHLPNFHVHYGAFGSKYTESFHVTAGVAGVHLNELEFILSPGLVFFFFVQRRFFMVCVR